MVCHITLRILQEGKQQLTPKNASFIIHNRSKNDVSMLDFTNPNMVKWYQDQMSRAVNTIGYHGWMYDYGEYTPPYSNASNGDTGTST